MPHPFVIFHLHTPAPPLDRFVEFLWLYDGFDPRHTMERLLPDGTMELVIDLREHPKRLHDRNDHSRATLYRRAWLSGMQSEYLVIGASPGSMMGAHFRAGGAWPFFGRPLSEFAGQVVEFDCVVGADAASLRDSLLEAPTPKNKFALLERFLLARGGDRLRADSAVQYALEQLVSVPTRLLIRDLAARVGISQKHLIQLFDCRVGLKPKQVDRVARFQRAIKKLAAARPADPDWAAIALDCGYYDQAHFIHDFQAFSGFTPTQYLKQPSEYTNYLIVDPPSATPQ